MTGMDEDLDAQLESVIDRALARLRQALGDDAGIVDRPANAERLGRVAAASDFAIDTLERQPALATGLLADDGADPRRPPVLDTGNRAEWAPLLRRYRTAESTRLLWRDVLGLDDLDDTLAGTTRPGAGIRVDVRPFFDDMGERLRDAHLLIARAGATTAADLLAMGRPAIFVPIPHGGSREEQRRNAETLAAAGVGWCMPEPELTAEALAAQLSRLFSSPTALPDAARAAAALGRPDAAGLLADVVERMLAERRG